MMTIVTVHLPLTVSGGTVSLISEHSTGKYKCYDLAR